MTSCPPGPTSAACSASQVRSSSRTSGAAAASATSEAACGRASFVRAGMLLSSRLWKSTTQMGS